MIDVSTNFADGTVCAAGKVMLAMPLMDWLDEKEVWLGSVWDMDAVRMEDALGEEPATLP